MCLESSKVKGGILPAILPKSFVHQTLYGISCEAIDDLTTVWEILIYFVRLGSNKQFLFSSFPSLTINPP